MDTDADAPRPKTSTVSTDDDLSRLSENDLTARIEILEKEIARTREALEAKTSARRAADAVFGA